MYTADQSAPWRKPDKIEASFHAFILLSPIRSFFKEKGIEFQQRIYFLERSKEIPIHVTNLKFLLIEVYKSLNCQNPMFMWDMFKRRETTYDLRVKDLLQLPSTKTTSYGINSILFRGSIMWNSIPDVVKNNQSIASFKKIIKTWNGEKCHCTICK